MVIGFYNARQYRIVLDDEELYSAGNSPFDSQQYTRPSQGVGLNRMKKYCIQTAKEIAKENNAKYIGVQYESVIRG